MSKITKKILGLGHPRTGTGYTSKLLQSWGLDVNHELMGNDGIVAWQFASNEPAPLFSMESPDRNFLTPNNFEFETIIYNVRNPFTSIPSIIYTENLSLNFRNKVVGFNYLNNPLSNALESIILWDKLIQDKKPNFTYRIENQEKELFDFLSMKYDNIKWHDSMVGKIYNQRGHGGWNSIMDKIESVPNELLLGINEYCVRYGYSEIFDINTKNLNHQ